MGTILKNIVQFTGLVVGVPTSEPHRLNVNGIPVMPKIGGADASGFTVTADAVNVTVTRTADAGSGDVNVYVEHWHTIESVTPLLPPPGRLFGLTPFFFATGGGGGPPSQLLALYGDGSFGDYVTAGDETWTSVAGAPGAPTIPAGGPFPFAFFNNLTISPGDSVAVGSATENAVVIFVKDTLTIGAGGRIHVNGFNGQNGHFPNADGGAGRKAIIGSEDGGVGGIGAFGGLGGPGNTGLPGVGGTHRPAQATATMIGGAGGTAGPFQLEPIFQGGAGGECESPPSWPYSLSHAMNIATLLMQIGGGNGGGGGAASGSSGFGGAGGGGAGTLVIFAKTIVAPAGSLQAIGGNGGNGFAVEALPSAGGGGGTGGSIVIVTENTTLLNVTDVSGGAGGNFDGNNARPGDPGGPGQAVAFNPMMAALIPV